MTVIIIITVIYLSIITITIINTNGCIDPKVNSKKNHNQSMEWLLVRDVINHQVSCSKTE